MTNEIVREFMEGLERSELLLGKDAMKRLEQAKVAVFGIGGVGSYVVEGLVRSGIGGFLLVDDDVIAASNLNRQLHATRDTIGRKKVQVMKERILSIQPEAKVETREDFVLYDNIGGLITTGLDYVVDSLDTVTAKLAIAERCNELGIPVIAAMGTGNKLNPALFQVGDIYQTSVCPLCKVMRKELRKRGISGLKVVYSREEPLKPGRDLMNEAGAHKKRQTPGSVSFVPSVAGLILAGEVIRDLISH